MVVTYTSDMEYGTPPPQGTDLAILVHKILDLVQTCIFRKPFLHVREAKRVKVSYRIKIKVFRQVLTVEGLLQVKSIGLELDLFCHKTSCSHVHNANQV